MRSWQRHLVDLGGRNTLLWYRDLPSGTLDLTTAHPGGVAMLMAGRPTKLSDLVREPVALQEARRRARTIRAKAIELQEERGITAGFIAVGMATWTAPGASRPPAAPVLLRSCVLKATGAAQQDFALDLGADVELNPVLEHYLRSEQGLELDADALADLSMVSKGFDPHPTFAALQRLCAGLPNFSISPRLVVGTFSYAKLPMVADLAAQGDTLADHDVVAALAGDPDALRAVRTAVPPAAADPEPDREHLVLDADSSQQAVIEAVRAGANLVIKGPPGTGKSQTIANLIASLSGDGKRVLFVAEKRAAIDAVVGRLDRLGLGDLVLDAHSGATNRRRLAQELGAALERASDAADPDTSEVERTLLERRTRLTDHATALHERREPWGVSAYDAQVELTRLTHRRNAPTSRVRIHGEALRAVSRDRVRELARELTDAASLGAWTTDRADDPWYAARVATADEAAQALEIASRLSTGGLDAAQERLGAALQEAGLPPATRAGRLGARARPGRAGPADARDVHPRGVRRAAGRLRRRHREPGRPRRARHRARLVHPAAAAPPGPRPAAAGPAAGRPARRARAGPGAAGGLGVARRHRRPPDRPRRPGRGRADLVGAAHRPGVAGRPPGTHDRRW